MPGATPGHWPEWMRCIKLQRSHQLQTRLLDTEQAFTVHDMNLDLLNSRLHASSVSGEPALDLVHNPPFPTPSKAMSPLPGIGAL